MSTPVFLLYDIQSREFRQYELEESCALQVLKTDTGMGRQDDLVEFILDTLATDDTYSICHALQCHIGIFLNPEI